MHGTGHPAGLVEGVIKLHADMTAWRRDIHAHPETAFEEVRTSEFVASKLAEFGIDVHRGLATTGVVGTLAVGNGQRRIGLRADMDALHIHEANAFSYRSKTDGKMHACGHDGHTAMLLGAARCLAERRAFDGIIDFIFQPAEENEGGARVMIEDGLFERFPVEAVYGMHNKPGIPVGEFGIRAGPILASYDRFEIKINGNATHAGLPYTGSDSIVAAGHMITMIQNLVRLNVHPTDAAVISLTQIHGGDTWNVIPSEVVLRGTVRCYRPEVQDELERALRRLATHCAETFETGVEITYERCYPPTINHPRETELASQAAAAVVGSGNVDMDVTPAMGAEDFAFMLSVKPGAYIYAGNGDGEDGCYLHNPKYDFNDDALVYGASYWVRLAENLLSTQAGDRLSTEQGSTPD